MADDRVGLGGRASATVAAVVGFWAASVATSLVAAAARSAGSPARSSVFSAVGTSLFKAARRDVATISASGTLGFATFVCGPMVGIGGIGRSAVFCGALLVAHPPSWKQSAAAAQIRTTVNAGSGVFIANVMPPTKPKKHQVQPRGNSPELYVHFSRPL